MLCSILKKAHNEREKMMRVQKAFYAQKEQKKHTQKGRLLDEIVKIELKFHTTYSYLYVDTRFPKKDILLYFLCALL